MPKNMKETPIGTIRIKTRNLKAYEKTNRGWKRTKKDVSSALAAVQLFKANKMIIKSELNSAFVAIWECCPMAP